MTRQFIEMAGNENTLQMSLWTDFWQQFPEQVVSIERLQEKLGHAFERKELLFEALTHRSAVSDFDTRRKKRGTIQNDFSAGLEVELSWNERLEFLGDSVLGFIITDFLWQNKGERTEGDLSRIRASLVNERVLADLAREISLGECLALGKGESQQALEKLRDSLLADALEALIGSLYLDAGIEKVRVFVKGLFSQLLAEDWDTLERDFKSKLQELTQDLYKITPSYKVIESIGPQHAKQFQIGVFLEHEMLASGDGANKKEASQEAAYKALLVLANKLKSIDGQKD
ncbi:MAG: ribonuclease III [Bdellovibrionota bacterium]